ncbi:MAG: alanine--tRNA ligase [Candidatus Woesearchaeota archaeon]
MNTNGIKTRELKEKYISFFQSKGHKKIESASLIPENDPTVLFTTAGMHPLVPFLMGQPHPLGKRLTDVQKCIRTGDIDEVGDECHLTFFEMLGNWSLGDYFKKEAIEMSFEFLTKELELPKEKLAVTCFAGDSDAPKDEEAFNVWKSLGISEKRIAFLPKKDNWWGPAGETGPCGPDTEMFYWTGSGNAPETFDPEDKKWVEIWNDVFMQYNKTKDGKYAPLEQKNVDTGLGVERVTMILNQKNNVYEIDSFLNIVDKIKEVAKISKIRPEHEKSIRVIADHMRAAVFILGDERTVTPSNVDQGYILRRFIRRSIRHLRLLGVDFTSSENNRTTQKIADVIISQYSEDYPQMIEKKDYILAELSKEEEKFIRTLDKGLKEFEKISGNNNINGKEAFLLFQSYGFPIEMIEELAIERNISLDKSGFEKEYEKHQVISRQGAENKFKGGLSEASDVTKKLHTATHLLNEALRTVLGPDIKQKGSNITPERLRFDFNFDRKMTDEEKKKVENLVNQKIQEEIPVKKELMPLKKALDSGAQAEFGARYPEEVWVYSVGDFSKEICMGPHVENTKELGHFRIKKEESSAAGVRRIKAVLD